MFAKPDENWKDRKFKIETKTKSLPLLFFSHSCLNQHWQQIKPLWYRKKGILHWKKKCDEIFWSPQVESRIIMQNFSWVTNRFWELFLWTFISLSYLQKTNLSWISWCFTVQSFFFREVNSSTLCERAAPPIRAHMVNKVPKWKVTHKLHVTCQFWVLNYGWKKCMILGHKL